MAGIPQNGLANNPTDRNQPKPSELHGAIDSRLEVQSTENSESAKLAGLELLDQKDLLHCCVGYNETRAQHGRQRNDHGNQAMRTTRIET